jgi:hypothetical protein
LSKRTVFLTISASRSLIISSRVDMWEKRRYDKTYEINKLEWMSDWVTEWLSEWKIDQDNTTAHNTT